MIIDLDYSEDLIEIPDLSKAPNLEIVSLTGCVSLCQLHPSIFTVPKLRQLCLDGCKKIESLKTNIHSKSLQTLDLTDCSSLVEFSVTSEEMTWLSLRDTAIHEFPSSMWNNSKLTHIDLIQCKNLTIVGKKLSKHPGLGSVTVLNLSGCTQINTWNLWFILDGMPSLKELNLRECCNLETLPDNIQNNSMLQILYLDECKKLKSIPKLPASLQALSAMNCTYLDTNSIQRPMFDNMLYRLYNNDGNRSNNVDDDDDDFTFFPGAQVPFEFDFHTTEASIVIPPIPKSGLCCFVVCAILSEGLDVYYDHIYCTIYEQTKEVDKCYIFCGRGRTLISDHVLLSCFWYENYKLVELDNKIGGDYYYNFSFEFKVKHCVDDEEQYWSTMGIEGCGVSPVYFLEHSLRLDCKSSSGVEIVELQLQSSAHVSDQHSKVDIDELQHQSSTLENEDYQQQLIPLKEKEEKSSCDCSIGMKPHPLAANYKFLIYLFIFKNKNQYLFSIFF
jgi:hypothetical protein